LLPSSGLGKKNPENEEGILFSRNSKAGRTLPDAITVVVKQILLQ
jgi:hypothetical protein